MCLYSKRPKASMSSPRKQHLSLHDNIPKTTNISHRSIWRAHKPIQLRVNEFQERFTIPYIIPKVNRSTIPQLKYHKLEESHRTRMNFHNLMPWSLWGINEIQPHQQSCTLLQLTSLGEVNSLPPHQTTLYPLNNRVPNSNNLKGCSQRKSQIQEGQLHSLAP